jgi:hypothetical protein
LMAAIERVLGNAVHAGNVSGQALVGGGQSQFLPQAGIPEANYNLLALSAASLPNEAMRNAALLTLVNYMRSNQSIAERIVGAAPGAYGPATHFDTGPRRQIELYASLALPELYAQITHVGRLLDEGDRLIEAVADSIENKKYPLKDNLDPDEDWKVYLYDRHNRLLDHVSNEIMPQLAVLRSELARLTGAAPQPNEVRGQG